MLSRVLVISETPEAYVRSPVADEEKSAFRHALLAETGGIILTSSKICL